MSFHVHVDQAGARSVNDDDSDQPQAVECVKVTIGAGTTRTQALRWLGQALREVSESYEPSPDGDEQPVAAAGEADAG